MTIIQLSNGKKVGNFSSPHPFTFEDGSVLPAVSPEEAERLKVTFIEMPARGGMDGDVVLKFQLSDAVKAAMRIWLTKWQLGEVDVVFCPLPMITAILEAESRIYLTHTPFRAIRLEDRIRKLASITKQCV